MPQTHHGHIIKEQWNASGWPVVAERPDFFVQQPTTRTNCQDNSCGWHTSITVSPNKQMTATAMNDSNGNKAKQWQQAAAMAAICFVQRIRMIQYQISGSQPFTELSLFLQCTRMHALGPMRNTARGPYLVTCKYLVHDITLSSFRERNRHHRQYSTW